MKRWTGRLACMIGLMAVLAGVAAAAADRKAELRDSFKKRYAAVEKLKADGKIGERWDGYAEARESLDARAQKLLAEENADRKELYELLSKDSDQKTPLMVGQVNAERYYKEAAKGYWFKLKNGEWRQKK